MAEEVEIRVKGESLGVALGALNLRLERDVPYHRFAQVSENYKELTERLKEVERERDEAQAKVKEALQLAERYKKQLRPPRDRE
jgi:hypothetical protein